MRRLLSPLLAVLALALAAPASAAEIVGSDQFGLVTLTVESVTVDPRTGIATVTGEAVCEPNTTPGTIVEISGTHIFVDSRRSNSVTSVVAVPCEPFSVELESLDEPFRPGKLFVDATILVTSGVPDQMPHTSFLNVAAETIARPTSH